MNDLEQLRELLPRQVAELAEAIGLQAAISIVEYWGGVRLCVPRKITADSEIAQRIGMRAAARLERRYSGETIQVPRAAGALREALYRRIVREYHGGRTAAELAREHGVTERWIYYLAARDRDRDDRQADLFG